jgi:hypothetical protein
VLSNFTRDRSTTTARVQNINEVGRMIGNLLAVLENDATLDHRWVAIAKTDLQKGFMALRRALEKPEEF